MCISGDELSFDARGNEDISPQNKNNFGAEIMKTKLVATIIVAGIMFFAACSNSHKTDADAAIKSAQTAYAAVADEANLYVPDQAKQVQADIQSAKDSFDKGDYEAADNASKGLAARIQDLTKAADAKKADLTAQWNDLNASVPGLLAADQKKVDALTKSHRLWSYTSPRTGVTRENCLLIRQRRS